MPYQGTFDERFQCFVIDLRYDYATKAGTLIVDGVPDMTGTLWVFTSIDPNVERVIAWRDALDYTLYHKRDGAWYAMAAYAGGTHLGDPVADTVIAEYPEHKRQLDALLAEY